MVVDVAFEERYWYPEAGGEVWLSGYQLVDAASGRYVGRDAPEVAGRGLRTTGVAGAAAHHAQALQSEAAAPGRPLVLVREPHNPHDANAIAVELTTGERLGFVPRELAAELAPRLDAGEALAAVVLREQRASPRDARTGVTMLVAPAARIELRDAT